MDRPQPTLIAAIEIGSSRISGAVAAVASDGKDINILVSHSTPLNDAVRHGRIQNILEVAKEVNVMIRRLENSPAVQPGKIEGVYLGFAGRSLTTVEASAVMAFPTSMVINDTTLENLRREAQFGLAPDKEILQLLPKRYLLDNAEVKKAIGTLGSRLRVDYSAIVCSPVLKRNLDCFKINEGRAVQSQMVITPVALANLVLTASEKQIGVLLLDFGDQTITLSAYKKGNLQWLRTLPFGSRVITTDLMTVLNMTEEQARNLKHTTASMRTLPEGAGAVDTEISECVKARGGEIVTNIINLINDSDTKLGDLPGGIVVAGGGALLDGFCEYLAEQTSLPVRFASCDSAAVRNLSSDEYPLLSILSILRHAATDGTKPPMACISMPVRAEQLEVREDEPAKAEENRPRTESYYPGTRNRRNEISEDDDDILEDDDFDNDGTPQQSRNNQKKKPKAPKGKTMGQRISEFFKGRDSEKEELAGDNLDGEDYGDGRNYDDDEYDDNYEDPYKPSMIGRISRRFNGFLNNDPANDTEDKNR